MSLCEAAQQALASMDQMLEGGEWYCARERAEALRAALAENERDWSLLKATQESLREHMAEIKTLRDALEQANNPKTIAEWWAAKQAASGEPLALAEYLILAWERGAVAEDYYRDIAEFRSTAQPARVPLTDDEIAQAMFRADAIVTGPMQFRFARAIEAAHGIRSKT